MLRAILYEHEIRRLIGVPGEGGLIVDGVAPLEDGEDRCLYFINKKVSIAVCDTLAALQGCIVIAPSGSNLADQLGNCLVLETPDPRATIAKVLGFIRAEGRQLPVVASRTIAPSAVISALAFVDGDVEIGDGAVIEPFCVVGPDVRIGCGSILRSGARVYPRVTIGDESVIGANTVVGHEGYGFVRDEMGNKTRIPHLGGVVIGSHVDIGALTTVLSGTISPTVIEDHAKIDDHVHVGHNVRIEKGASVTAGVVIGGHAVVESEAWVGINSSIRDGRRIGSRALVGMDVSVQQDLAENAVARAPRPDVRLHTENDSDTIGFKDQ